MDRLGTFATAAVLFLGVALPSPASADSQVRQLVGEWKLVNVTNALAKLRVFAAGTGPTIVMLPGGGRGPVAVEPVAKRLVAAGFRVVLPEPRAYGESVGPLEGVTLRDLSVDVARAIETVGGAPVIVAGHAYGNRVGRMLGQDRPDLVRGVVLMAAGGKFSPSQAATQNLRTFQDKSLPPERRTMAAKAAFFGPNSNPTPDDIMLDGISAETIKMQGAAIDPKLFPLESWWPGGKGPMLVIQGLSDVIAPPENGRSLKSDYPNRVTLVELPGVGNAMTLARPDLVAVAITSFVHKLGN